MKNFIKLTQLFLILIFLTACKTSIKNDKIINESDEPASELNSDKKSRMEIRLSCGEEDISKFIDDGWIIIKESTEEKICTWKSYPATKKCDMEKDKGCKITKPDKIGVEKIYLLEK